MPARVRDLAPDALDEITPIVRLGEGVAHGRFVELVGHSLSLRVDDGERHRDVRADIHAVAALELGSLDALPAYERPVGRFEVFEEVTSVTEELTRAWLRLTPASSN